MTFILSSRATWRVSFNLLGFKPFISGEKIKTASLPPFCHRFLTFGGKIIVDPEEGV